MSDVNLRRTVTLLVKRRHETTRIAAPNMITCDPLLYEVCLRCTIFDLATIRCGLLYLSFLLLYSYG